PEVYDRLDGRRSSIKNFVNVAGKVALTSLPFAFGSMFKKAYGQTSTPIIGVLNFALTLEYLEAEFYNMGLAAANLIPAGEEKAAFQVIANHENAHVAFLKTAITGAGGTPVAKPTFDFSGGNGSGNGPFKTAFSDYTLFLAVSQTLEDTGVRAYKGQAGALMSNNDILTAALNIHSVEARHAAKVRKIRKDKGAPVKPWITLKDTGGIGALVQANYDGEENTNQAGIEITNIASGITASIASEAFDEPLTQAQVLALVDGFIV
ncbi:MAG TPA: ferritin-like domain-containing protein, partial [Flavitalea sp.]|nr:ferritin-like domain-containing protein [Flavitalea sp.]